MVHTQLPWPTGHPQSYTSPTFPPWTHISNLSSMWNMNRLHSILTTVSLNRRSVPQISKPNGDAIDYRLVDLPNQRLSCIS